MLNKCYNKTHNKALRDGNLKGLLINNSLSGVIMTASNNTRYIERGQYRKHLIYGVGFNSRGKHKSKESGKKTDAYMAWHDMIKRCYCSKALKKNPSYIGCSVDRRWHDFQDFADWFYSHLYSSKGYELDKDLLVPDNKVYSPETCCFVPQEVNKLLLNHKAARGRFPQGVCFHKRVGKYIARLNVDGKNQHIGYFFCPNEAYQAYKQTKERYVKNKALEWANRIQWNAFLALMNWTLDS